MRHLLTLCCLLHSFLLCAQDHIVYFESAKDSISQSEAITLDSIINLLDQSKAYKVAITGHTDSRGGITYNQALSRRRANEVEQYINKSGIPFEVSLMWEAYFNPAQPNTSDEGKARNRRVEISFTEIIFEKDVWDMPVQEFKLNASKAYLLRTKNGCKITIRPGSFNVNIGDTVHVLITEYNDPADFLAGSLPMSYNKGGQEFMYQSEQMMKIEAIVDEKPVELLQMIGLECPEIDVLEGLRLYKFHGKKESFVDLRQKKIAGTVEEIEEEQLNYPKAEETKESSKEKISTSKTKQSEETTNSSKKNNKSKQTAGSNKNQKVTSKKKKRGKKEKATKGKRTKIMITSGSKSRFKLEPDTGRTFLLEPDTGRTFLLEPDTGRSTPWTPDILADDCSLLGLGNSMLCNLDSLKQIVEFGHALNGNQIPISIETDLNLYYTRYKSPAYHGMTLKCRKDAKPLNYVRVSSKKHFLCRRLILKFESAPENPEYLAFKNTKWIVRYKKAFNDAQKIKNIEINDFRIIPFKKADYSKKSKEGYFIELKGENEMFRFPAKPRKKKKSAIAFKEFRKAYRTRIQSFDDSIRQSIVDKQLVKHVQFYELLQKLSRPRDHYCLSSSYLPSCLDFFILDGSYDLPNSNDCFPLRKPNCEAVNFLDWIAFYNANGKYIQKQVTELKKNLPKYFHCLCGKDTIKTDTLLNVTPCHKWEYADINAVGNKITYIGLGIYNLDYVFRLDAKQVITNPLFITTEGDTVRTCWSTNYKGVQQTGCNHQLFSIIPKFNGLLEHTFLPRISLILNKENILFLTTMNKRYKCYVDMTKQDKFIGNTFIVQDITEKSKTLEGLRNELTKMD